MTDKLEKIQEDLINLKRLIMGEHEITYRIGEPGILDLIKNIINKINLSKDEAYGSNIDKIEKLEKELREEFELSKWHRHINLETINQELREELEKIQKKQIEDNKSLFNIDCGLNKIRDVLRDYLQERARKSKQGYESFKSYDPTKVNIVKYAEILKEDWKFSEELLARLSGSEDGSGGAPRKTCKDQNEGSNPSSQTTDVKGADPFDRTLESIRYEIEGGEPLQSICNLCGYESRSPFDALKHQLDKHYVPKERYEKLLSLAIEVKKENTEEFIQYFEGELQKCLDGLGIDTCTVKHNEGYFEFIKSEQEDKK